MYEANVPFTPQFVHCALYMCIGSVRVQTNVPFIAVLHIGLGTCTWSICHVHVQCTIHSYPVHSIINEHFSTYVYQKNVPLTPPIALTSQMYM